MTYLNSSQMADAHPASHNALEDTALDRITAGTVGTDEIVQVTGATSAGSVVNLKPSHEDGYCQIQFFPEQGANQDMAILVHKESSGTETNHRHMSIYASEVIGEAPHAKVNLEYGVADPEFQFSRCHVDFDVSAAPGSGGGYAEKIVLGNTGFVQGWNAAGSARHNLVGVTAGDQFELGSTGLSNSILALQDLEFYNSYLKVPIVATGSLPAAGSDMNGAVIIEDAGAGDRNLIIYAGAQRFRIDGGANF